MSDFVFNVAKGRVNELVRRVAGNDPANSALIVVLLKTAASDATLMDQADLAAILAGGSVECDFTNYARKTLTDSVITNPTITNASDKQEATMPNQTWTAAGGTTNNTIVKLLVCYDSDTTSGTDSGIIPLTAHDFSLPTNGGDITAQVNASGFYRAT